MTLHAKMEALRKALNVCRMDPRQWSVDKIGARIDALLAEWDRPASERAKEWRKAMQERVLQGSTETHLMVLLDEACRAITHAGDDGELPKFVPDLRSLQADNERLRAEVAETHQHNMKLMARLLQSGQFIDKLLDRLAAKGAT